MKKFEHRLVKMKSPPDDSYLSLLSKSGWELVSVLYHQERFFPGNDFWVYIKREQEVAQ